LNNYEFEQTQYEIKAKHYEARDCHQGSYILRIKLPQCETMKLEFYSYKHLYHYDWQVIGQTIKHLELKIDSFNLARPN